MPYLKNTKISPTLDVIYQSNVRKLFVLDETVNNTLTYRVNSNWIRVVLPEGYEGIQCQHLVIFQGIFTVTCKEKSN